eukprot:scaffold8818_cov73-Cyclotella_meneghiniana.AAC.1
MGGDDFASSTLHFTPRWCMLFIDQQQFIVTRASGHSCCKAGPSPSCSLWSPDTTDMGLLISPVPVTDVISPIGLLG